MNLTLANWSWPYRRSCSPSAAMLLLMLGVFLRQDRCG